MTEKYHGEWYPTNILGYTYDMKSGVFYRQVSNEPITEAQKQKALEEKRKAEGWVVWGMGAEVAVRSRPHTPVRIIAIDEELNIVVYYDSLTGVIRTANPESGYDVDFRGFMGAAPSADDLVPYVEKKRTVWDLKKGDDCVFIYSFGGIAEVKWLGNTSQLAARKYGNVFLTVEEANARLESWAAEAAKVRE